MLTCGKARSLLGIYKDPTASQPHDGTPPIPIPGWATLLPTCGLLGPGLSLLPLAMAVLQLNPFLGAPAIHYQGGERCRAFWPQTYPLLSCVWLCRLFSVLSGGQVLYRHLLKCARAARALGMVLCLTVRRTAAMQSSCEPWHGGCEKAPVIPSS